MDKLNTEAQFQEVMRECRQLFELKLHDYSPSWRLMRPTTVTDQLFIKAKRIRTLTTASLPLYNSKRGLPTGWT